MGVCVFVLTINDDDDDDADEKMTITRSCIYPVCCGDGDTDYIFLCTIFFFVLSLPILFTRRPETSLFPAEGRDLF